MTRFNRRILTPVLVGLLFILLFYSVRLFHYVTSHDRHIEPWTCNLTEKRSKHRPKCFNNDTKIILFYTPWFYNKPWPDFDSKELNLPHSNCPEKNCKISYDVNDIGRSDLVIFHAPDMESFLTTKELQQIHKYRCPTQRMAFLSHESAQTEPLHNVAIPNGFFNWTITFKKKSDFYFPYGGYFRLPPSKNPPKLVNYASEKSQFVLWAVSHCGTIRERYVKKLLKYIQVDIYGKCSGVYGQDKQCPQSDGNCENIFKRYKFYLAFENGVCTDYITEKFWSSFRRNAVPIVLTKDFYGPDAVPPGSFISVQDFPSVKALAEYLLYLDKNDTAYNEYFLWKQKFGFKRIFSFSACDVCDSLHNECLKPKAYYNFLDTFWNEEVDCKEREQTLSKLIGNE